MKAQHSHLSPIFALTILLFSCNERNTAKLAPEYLFNAGSQKVIKSIINNKKETITVLYGNEQAIQTASNSLTRPQTGASYTMVTWKQKPMPRWYGTNMNGEIYAVETVKVLRRMGPDSAFEYHFKTGSAYKTSDKQPERNERIHFIINQRAAIFP